ncbi:MAG: anaerobic ribonucleoside-triphosphate reductase activating protein [Eubacteriales bacterium]|jgi:pyruvate formate lyase activating enzyme|nr:anaerobic ribonucleoside-triphosphate reductase activating protein [Clostridiales bacterium]
MKISGFNKLTLIDYPGKVACTVFTPGCNMRCPFCQNASLVKVSPTLPIIDEEEFFLFLSKRQGILDGVAITGGEPIFQPDITQFAKKIKDMGFSVKIDTNGVAPHRLREVISSGAVDYVAMDIKNSPSKYKETCGLTYDPMPDIRESSAFIMESAERGIIDYEFRTTAVAEFHTPSDFVEIGRWLMGARRYFIQRFEDSGDILTEGLHAPSDADMKVLLDAVLPYIPSAELRGVTV